MTRVLLVLVAVLALCQPAVAQKKLKVVATFSIVGDMVARIGGDEITLTTLVRPDADAHAYEPTPGDAKVLAGADIIFANGLGFDGWVERLRDSTRSRAEIVPLANFADPWQIHDHGFDPHVWQDVRRTIPYARMIVHHLVKADATRADTYRKRGLEYVAELRALDAEIRAALNNISKSKRRVITTHDAFGYFARAYDVEFLAPLGISTDAQPSAKEVAGLIKQIRREKIRAVFVENISDPRLIEQIARETGAKIGGKLYSDALSTKAGPAPTYIAMMRHNVRLLTAPMAPGL